MKRIVHEEDPTGPYRFRYLPSGHSFSNDSNENGTSKDCSDSLTHHYPCIMDCVKVSCF